MVVSLHCANWCPVITVNLLWSFMKRSSTWIWIFLTFHLWQINRTSTCELGGFLWNKHIFTIMVMIISITIHTHRINVFMHSHSADCRATSLAQMCIEVMFYKLIMLLSGSSSVLLCSLHATLQLGYPHTSPVCKGAYSSTPLIWWGCAFPDTSASSRRHTGEEESWYLSGKVYLSLIGQ